MSDAGWLLITERLWQTRRCFKTVQRSQQAAARPGTYGQIFPFFKRSAQKPYFCVIVGSSVQFLKNTVGQTKCVFILDVAHGLPPCILQSKVLEYYSFKNFLIFGPFCVVKQKEPFGLKGTAKEGAQAAWWTKPSSFSPARESGGMEGMDGCTN